MALLDFLMQPGGILSRLAAPAGMLSGNPLQPAAAPSYAPQWAPGGKAASLMPKPTIPQPWSAATPAGSAAASSPIADFFRNNPSTVAALAAGIGGAPSMRMGLAQAAGALPQSMQQDRAWADQNRSRQATQAYFSDPANTKGLPPSLLKVVAANPELANSVLSLQLMPKTPVVVHPGDTLIDPTTHQPVYSAGSGYRPMTAAEKSQWGVASNMPGYIGPDGKPAVIGNNMINIYGDTVGGPPQGGAPGAPGGAPAKPQLFPGEKDDVYLQTLAPQYQELVKGITSYTMDPTKVTSLRGDERAAVLAAAQRYDPTFDMAKYPTRQAMAKSVTTGNYANSVNAANTAVGHLNTLKEIAGNLNNGSFPTVNAFLNFMKQQTGDDAPTNFAVVVNGLASELGKLYKGTGAASLEEVNAWRDSLNPNMSPQQFEGAINTALEMMSSRLATINDQYVNTMGGTLPYRMLTPQSVAILKRIGIDPDIVEHGDITGNLWPGLNGGAAAPAVNAPRAAGGGAPGAAAPAAGAAPAPAAAPAGTPSKEGDTATGPNGQKAVFKAGRWINTTTGQPL